MKIKITSRLVVWTKRICILTTAIQLPVVAETNSYPISDSIIQCTSDRETSDFIFKESFYFLSYASRHETFPDPWGIDNGTSPNWGATADGLKLAIGFNQKEFLLSEPVISLVILRNLNSHNRAIVMNDYNFKITVSSGTNTIAYSKNKPSRWGTREDPGQFFGTVKGGSERLIAVNLSRFFDLNHLGAYSVQIKIQEPASNGNGVTNITSGKASFQIVEKLSASELAARKIYDDRISEFKQFLKDQATNSPVKSK